MLERQLDQTILTLRLARPPVNALDPQLVQALSSAIVEAPSQGVEAIVLTGQPGMFSGGLDVPTLLGLDEDGLRKMFRAYFSLCSQVAESPVPICAAISGHSPAGGAVVALHCDYRIMAEGKYLIGLNETRVGLALPNSIYRALAYVVGARHAERLGVSGLMVGPQEALAVGLVDEVVATEVVHERAVQWCQKMLLLPRHAMQANRTTSRKELRDAAASYEGQIDAFVAFWFLPETQAALGNFLKKLVK